MDGRTDNGFKGVRCCAEIWGANISIHAMYFHFSYHRTQLVARQGNHSTDADIIQRGEGPTTQDKYYSVIKKHVFSRFLEVVLRVSFF